MMPFLKQNKDKMKTENKMEKRGIKGGGRVNKGKRMRNELLSPYHGGREGILVRGKGYRGFYINVQTNHIPPTPPPTIFSPSCDKLIITVLL